MSSVLIIFIALVLSVFYRYNTTGTETVWWETHIPTFTFIVLSLYLLLSQKFRHQVIYEFAMSMATISIVGVVSVFLASRYNTSIYAMGITLSIPALTYFADTNKKWLLTIIVLVYLTCFVAVSLAGSRTGIIAMLLSAIYLSYRILHFKKYILLSSGILMLFAIVSVLIFIKNDSTAGRAFILKNSMEMIAERPLGWGEDGFESNYMLRQAEFFRNNNDETTAMLADDIKHPLNEFLYIAVNYGVHILLLLLAIIGTTIYLLYKKRDKESCCCLHFIALLLLWSCFSYPLFVSFVLVMAMAYIPVLPFTNSLITSKSIIRYTMVALLLAYGGASIMAFNDERIWNNAINEYREGNKQAAMAVFNQWKNYRIDKGRLLFSLATVEYNNKDYDRCINIYNECKNYLSSYDLELIIANCYMFTGNHDKALEHFSLAHNMCPNRFVPLYKKFKIYKEQGDTAMIENIGNEILTKKIKVHSHKIDIINNNVRFEMQRIKNNDITFE